MSGQVNVRHMLRSLSAKDFIEWEAYASLEPFGEIRADWRAASIREMVHNTQVEQKSRRPVKDFLLTFSESETATKQGWQYQLAVAKIIAHSQAAKVRDKK